MSVKVGIRMSQAAASCSDPRHLFPTAVHCVASVSATLPLIMSLPSHDSLAVTSDAAVVHQWSGCADETGLLVSDSV